MNSETDITSYKTTETLTHTFGPGCYCPAGIPDNSYVSSIVAIQLTVFVLFVRHIVIPV